MDKKSTLVFDGGFATQLALKGYDIDGDPLWSARMIANDEVGIINVHKEFLKAGADVILSATYQASVPGFMKYLGCSFSEAEHLIHKAAKIVKKACEDHWLENKDLFGEENRPLSCASMGPYGAFLADGSEYNGSYIDTVPLVELIEFHKQRLDILAHNNLDLYLFETIPSIQEAEVILSIIREYPNNQFAISFSCRDNIHLNHGETFIDAIRIINKNDHVLSVGVNCTSPEYICRLLESVKNDNVKNMLVMPNSGEIWADKKWKCDPIFSLSLSKYLEQWIALGANWIGGCCRTTPTDISKIKKYLIKSGEPNLL